MMYEMFRVLCFGLRHLFRDSQEILCFAWGARSTSTKKGREKEESKVNDSQVRGDPTANTAKKTRYEINNKASALF